MYLFYQNKCSLKYCKRKKGKREVLARLYLLHFYIVNLPISYKIEFNCKFFSGKKRHNMRLL